MTSCERICVALGETSAEGLESPLFDAKSNIGNQENMDSAWEYEEPKPMRIMKVSSTGDN